MKKTIINTYNSIVKEYAMHEESNLSMQKHYGFFLSLLSKHSKILDVGCGPGQATKEFVKNENEVIGIDLAKNMIEYAKKKIIGAKFYVMDVEKITLTKKFDAIWAAFILVHIKREKHLKILKKFNSLLEKDGILFLGLINGEGEKIIPEPYNREFEQHFILNNKKEIFSNLSKAGFEIIKYSTEEFDEEGDLFMLTFTFARKK